MSLPDRVQYGYGTVTEAEKRRLVDGHFDAIAPRYDLADTLMSFGLDRRWRAAGVRLLSLKRGDAVLDLCGGTAGLALEAARAVLPGGSVTVCDISRAMMLAGKRRAGRAPGGDLLQWIQADAENLPFGDGVFEAVTVGFGVRNLVNLDRGLGEAQRVLRPSGRLMILEFSVPRRGWFGSLYDLYSFRAMPLAGRLITGTAAPFRYLAESVRTFPSPEAVAALLAEKGFAEVSFERRTGGIVTIYIARKNS